MPKKKWGKLQHVLRRAFGLRKKPSAKHRVIELYDRGRPQEALILAIKYAERHPNKRFFQYMAGRILKESGETRDACRYLSQAFALRPDDHEAFDQLVSAIANSKNAADLAEQFSGPLSKALGSAYYSASVKGLIRTIAAMEGLERAGQVYARFHQDAGRLPKVVLGAIHTVRDWANLTGSPLLEVGEIETIPFKAPIVYGAPPSPEPIYGSSNKPYVAEIANARVFSNSGVILTADGAMLNDEAGHAQFGEYVSFEYEKKLAVRQKSRLLLDLTEYTERKTEAAMLLSGLGSESFGHWFPEFLPRIQFFRQHPEFANLPIIVDAGMPTSHFDQLRRLVKNEFIVLGESESLICSRLLVASSPTFLPVHLTVGSLKPHDVPGMSPRALQFLQSELPSSSVAKPFRRIFLARENMLWRRLLNESEVAAALVALGFEVIHIEKMSAAEQIEVFQQADWIVAPNGSALLNIVFSAPSVKVLVISQPNLFNWGAFQGPIEVLGYRPVFVCGQFATDGSKKHSDYSVPPSLIVEALRDMGLPSLH